MKKCLRLILACFLCLAAMLCVPAAAETTVDLAGCKSVLDLGLWTSGEPYGANHIQGICVDDEGKYMYASFTNVLAKIDIATGELVGSVYGLATGTHNNGGHIGDVYYHDGKVYSPMGYTASERWFIAVFDADKITKKDMHYTAPGVMSALYLPQVGDDFREELLAGEHDYAPSSMGHRYGTSGIDGITIGKLPGGGYDTDGDGDVDISTGDKQFMLVAYNAAENAKRYDNENFILLVYDLGNITEQNLLPFDEADLEMEYTEEQCLFYEHKIFTYAGNHDYGIQQVESDPVTGDIWLESYNASTNTEFSHYTRYLLDGSVPLYMDIVEVGQSVTGDSSGFITRADALATAALYTDYEDGDGDGDYSEQETGWHAAMKCICKDAKTMADHEEETYGATGKPCKICGRGAQFDTGLAALGNDYFYGAKNTCDFIDGVRHYGAVARLYKLNRETWTFEAYRHYPYVFEDFENGIETGTGAGGSKHSMKYRVTGTYDDVSFVLAEPPKVGDDLTFSAWVKIDNTTLTDDKITFLLWGTGRCYRTSEDTSLPAYRDIASYISVDATSCGMQKGEWVYVTVTKKSWDGKIRGVIPAGYDNMTADTRGWMETVDFTRASIRLTGPSSAADAVGVVEYCFDDFSFYPSSAAEAAEESGGSILGGSAMDSQTDVDCWTASYKAFVNQTGPDGSSGYMSVGDISKSSPKELKQSVTLKANRLYKVSFWARIEDVPEGTDAVGGLWMLQYMKDRIADTNGYHTNYPGVKLSNILTTEWKKHEFYYLREHKTFAEQPADIVFRFYQGTDENAANNYMKLNVDDLKIVDAGPVANGDFSVGAASVYQQKPKTNHAVETAYGVLSWTENGATAAWDNGALKIAAATDGGNAYQGINMDNGGTYKLSFRAKINSAEEKPLAVVLDRYVEASGGDSEAYSVPDYQYITGANEISTEYTDSVKANQEWKVGGEWQTYTCYITNEFPLLSGKSETTGVVPRAPYLYFDVDGNAAGTELYVDDITMEKVSAAPEVLSPQVLGENIPGNVLTFDYDFGSSTGAAENCVVIRAWLKDGGQSTSLGTYDKGDVFTVPESAIGKELVFAFTPFDSNFVIGKTVSVIPAEPAGSWGKLYFDADTKTVRAYYSENIHAEIAFASYKENTLLDVKIVPVSLTALQAAAADAAALYTTGADTVKVMLWSSLSSAVPLCESIIAK